jgi:predicted phosphodiesterase
VSPNKNWEFWALLVSDQHHDNPKARHDLERKHLQQAKERGAAIVSCGDQLCLMQGKYDKRANKSALRPEHQVDNYLDAVVETAADFYQPFAFNFVCFGVGNHEKSIEQRHETRVIDRLVGVLNDRTGSHIHVGGFSGWVVFSFNMGGAGKQGRSVRVVLHYDHGYGGGGAVTSDMIQHHRRSVYLPDADIVISGHTHDAWMRELSRVRLSTSGVVRHDVQTHIKLPTYKEEYGDGYGGWHVETGKAPRPLGGWWVRFYFDRPTGRVLYEVVRAQ